MLGQNPEYVGCVLKASYREKGEAVIDGTKVKWEEGFVIEFLPLEGTSRKIRKFVVLPEKEEEISSIFDTVYWGCLVELTLKGKYVSDVEVLRDWLGKFYEANK